MIVKVQLSITTAEAARQVLIYNEDKSVFYKGDAPAEVVKAMGNEVRAFFRARLVGATIKLYKKTLAWPSERTRSPDHQVRRRKPRKRRDE